MKQIRLAKRYSKALFDLAKEEGKLEEYLSSVRRLLKAFQLEPNFLKLLSLRELESSKRNQLLEKLVKRLQLSSYFENFLKLLLRRGRIAIYPEVAQVFESLVRQNQNVILAKVKVAQKASTKSFEDSIRKALENLTGKKIEFQLEESPSLIGGIQVSIGDTIFDASLKGALKKIEEAWC